MTQAGKLQKVVTMYLKKVSKQNAFAHGKPTKEYWLLRSYLLKQDPDFINISYDYLTSQDEFEFMNVYTFTDKAKAYQAEMRWKETKEGLSKIHDKADSYSFDSLMSL